MSEINLLDVVALVEDVRFESADAEDVRLARGQVGAVVEVLDPNTYEVEFCDDEGRTYALLPLRAQQLMRLRFMPADRAA